MRYINSPIVKRPFSKMYTKKNTLNASLLYYAYAANASAYEYLQWALIYANAKML